MFLLEQQRIVAREQPRARCTGRSRSRRELPMIAATVSSSPSSQTLSPNCGCAASRPAVTSSESPGRKKPTSSPVSAKMIAVSPTYPPPARAARTP